MTQPLTNVQKKFGNLPYLDSLRGLAAIYVVMHHVTLMLLPDYFELPFSVTDFNTIFILGHYSVDLFIILSGFCLMLPVIQNDGKLRGGITTFLKKRARRILPPYYLAMGLSILLIATVIGYKTSTIWDNALPVNKTDIITHLILIQDIFPETSSKINYVFWSIAVEWGIYLVFPLILIGWRKFGAFTTTATTNIVSYGLFLPLKVLHLNISPWGICPHYFGLFAFGMLAVEILFSQELRFKRLRKSLPWSLMTVVFAGFAIMAYNLKYHSPFWPLCDLTAGICFFCLLISVASNSKTWFYQILVWKPLVFIGTFAYSIYLIHAPFIQLLYQYLILPLSLTSRISIPILSCLISITIIPIAYLFFLVAERPFLNKKRS